MHDTNPPTLLRWEAQQRREAGYDTAQLEAQIERQAFETARLLRPIQI